MSQFSILDFKILEKDLKQIIGARINQTTIINSREFLITFSMIKKEKMFISLNHNGPVVSLIDSNISISTISCKLNEVFRKYLKDSYILDFNVLENDRVLIFKLQKSNDLFEKDQYYLYVECIPQRPNLIICDQNNKVVFAMHYSSLENKRPILINTTYSLPQEKLKPINCQQKSLNELKIIIKSLLFSSLDNRKIEKYEPLYKHIKIRIKALNRKLNILSQSIENAQNTLVYQEYGNCVLSYANEKELLEDFINQNNLQYDFSITPGLNANNYFKKYKKAKRTIEINKLEYQKTIEEIDYLTSIDSSSKFMSDDELFALANEILPNKYKQDYKHPKEVKPSYILCGKTQIIFGKNAKSNNEVTFKIANKTDTYLHIKDYHGAHVIIKNDNPTNEELLLASEIALILSNKSVGDIYYTKVKDVKKTEKLGLVNLLSYKTIHLNLIREETIKLLNNSCK